MVCNFLEVLDLAVTGFLRPFTHLTSGDAPVGEEKLVLVAALMGIGMGMNLGLTRMEQSCPYTYRRLSWSLAHDICHR